jgi:hypothetical protein
MLEKELVVGGREQGQRPWMLGHGEVVGHEAYTPRDIQNEVIMCGAVRWLLTAVATQPWANICEASK